MARCERWTTLAGQGMSLAHDKVARWAGGPARAGGVAMTHAPTRNAGMARLSSSVVYAAPGMTTPVLGGLAALPAVRRLIELALDEDLGRGDVTSRAVFGGAGARAAAVPHVVADMVAREPIVAFGIEGAAAAADRGRGDQPRRARRGARSRRRGRAARQHVAGAGRGRRGTGARPRRAGRGLGRDHAGDDRRLRARRSRPDLGRRADPLGA